MRNQKMKVICRYARLSDVPDLRYVEEYQKRVSPWDYDYGLELNGKYCVLGIEARGCIPRLYITPINDQERRKWASEAVMNFPAVLFEFNWSDVPKDWVMRISGAHHDTIEIFPKALAQDEAWFERYLDAEEDAIELVNQEIERALKRL